MLILDGISNNRKTSKSTSYTAPLKHPLAHLTHHVCPLALQFVLTLQVPQGMGEGDLVFSGEEGWEFLL